MPSDLKEQVSERCLIEDGCKLRDFDGEFHGLRSECRKVDSCFGKREGPNGNKNVISECQVSYLPHILPQSGGK